MDKVIYIDTEVSENGNAILDYGAALDINTNIHTRDWHQFLEFVR